MARIQHVLYFHAGGICCCYYCILHLAPEKLTWLVVSTPPKKKIWKSVGTITPKFIKFQVVQSIIGTLPNGFDVLKFDPVSHGIFNQGQKFSARSLSISVDPMVLVIYIYIIFPYIPINIDKHIISKKTKTQVAFWFAATSPSNFHQAFSYELFVHRPFPASSHFRGSLYSMAKHHGLRLRFFLEPIQWHEHAGFWLKNSTVVSGNVGIE